MYENLLQGQQIAHNALSAGSEIYWLMTIAFNHLMPDIKMASRKTQLLECKDVNLKSDLDK